MSKKRRSTKRIRRVYLKHYAHKYVRGGLAEYNDKYHYSINEPWLNKVYPGISSKSESHRAIELKIKALEQGTPSERCIYVEGQPGSRYNLRLMFNHDYTIFFFIKENRFKFERSITYGSRERAMRAYGYRKITWVHEQIKTEYSLQNKTSPPDNLSS